MFSPQRWSATARHLSTSGGVASGGDCAERLRTSVTSNRWDFPHGTILGPSAGSSPQVRHCPGEAWAVGLYVSCSADDPPAAPQENVQLSDSATSAPTKAPDITSRVRRFCFAADIAPIMPATPVSVPQGG